MFSLQRNILRERGLKVRESIHLLSVYLRLHFVRKMPNQEETYSAMKSLAKRKVGEKLKSISRETRA